MAAKKGVNPFAKANKGKAAAKPPMKGKAGAKPNPFAKGK